jgi:hypothetical protein
MSEQDRPKGQHGGKRRGAGRKAKVLSATVLARADVELLLAEVEPDQIETIAQRHARMAIAALVKNLLKGAGEAARLRAACEILDRGYGKPAVEIGGDAMLPFAPAPAPLVQTVSQEMRSEARKYANLAVEVLRRIAEFGASETAAVAACKAILDRSFGTAGMAKMPDDFKDRPLGKKEMAARSAVLAATGIYAVPPAPKGTRSGGDDEGSVH